MVIITNENNKHNSSKIVLKLILKLIGRVALIYQIIQSKMKLNINQIQNIYFYLIDVSRFVNTKCIDILLGNGNLASSAVKTVIATTIPLITVSYLEHIVTKEKLSVSKQNIKNIILGSKKTETLTKTLHIGAAGLLGKSMYSAFNQILMQSLGYDRQMDKLLYFTKEIMNNLTLALFLNELSDAKKLSALAINKVKNIIIDQIYSVKVIRINSVTGKRSNAKGRHIKFNLC